MPSILAAVLLFAPAGPSFAGSPSTLLATDLPTARVNEAHAAVTADGTRDSAPDTRIHILPSTFGHQTIPRAKLFSNNFKAITAPTTPASLSAPAPDAAPLAAFPTTGDWSPADLKNYGGNGLNVTGVKTLKQINIYLNCPAKNDSCWGTAAGQLTGFQTALSKSTFMTIVDQYVGATSADRYKLGTPVSVTKTLRTTAWSPKLPMITDADAQAIALAAATASNQFGYGYIYHIFVPKGTDVCDSTSVNAACYSPDHFNNFVFCGYHGSFGAGAKHVLYSVEPYAGVVGCQATGQSALHAQASVLSHELFEAVTDPDPNVQWNAIALDALGEIGDICAGLIYQVALSSTQKFNLQLEYTNTKHACSTSP